MSAWRYHQLAIALLIFFMGAGISTETAACSCLPGYQSPNIVRATVIDIYEPSEESGRERSYFAFLKIEQTHRGSLTGYVAIFIENRQGSACGINLPKGATLNIGIDYNEYFNVYSSNLCSNIGVKQ